MRTFVLQSANPQRRAIEEILVGRGHIVVCGERVEAAIAAQAAAPFDLIIADLALPAFSFRDFSRRLRESDQGAWCVLIVIPAGASPHGVDDALRAGTDDYLARTEDPELLAVELLICERRVSESMARRSMIRTLAETQTRLDDLLATAPDAILQVNAAGRILLINDQAEKLFGYRREELVGQPVELLLPEHYRTAHVEQRRRYFEHPATRPMGTNLNLTLLRKNGTIVAVDICIGYHRTEQEYVIVAVRDVTERRRLEDDLRLAKEAAEHAYERIRRDIQAAAQLQRALLPDYPPRVAGVQFAWAYHPCAGLGGDGLNVFQLDDDHVGFYLLDVSGHGVASALLSVTLARLLSPSLSQSTLLRVPEDGGYRLVPPGEVACQLNEWFLANPAGEQYFTMIYGILEIQTRRIRFVSAGHPGLLHVRNNGEPAVVRVPGFPIGWTPDAQYSETTLNLNRGDRVFLYSDGLIEACNSAGEAFGVDRLRQVAAVKEPVQSTTARMVDEVVRWSGNPDDDLSVLAVGIE
jgi:PAS domain S-box-containing protein